MLYVGGVCLYAHKVLHTLSKGGPMHEVQDKENNELVMTLIQLYSNKGINYIFIYILEVGADKFSLLT